MAYTDGLLSGKVDSPWRTADGETSHNFPVTGLPEVKVIEPGCSGCPKRADHQPCKAIGFSVPFGETRHQRVAADKQLTAEQFHRLAGAIWMANYIHAGLPTDVIWGAGGANNAVQQVTYKIVSVSGNTLTLRGRNPKRLVFGRSVPNPEWPVGPRYLVEDEAFALGAGAMVVFAYPSVLARKLRPWIREVNPPASNALEDVEFTVEVSASVSAAMEPEDAAAPPAAYYCTIFMEALFPAGWPNVQPGEEGQFAARAVTFTSVDCDGFGDVTLVDSDGGNTRVLWPDMIPAGLTVLIRQDGAPVAGLTAEQIAGRLKTVQIGRRSWVTTLNLGDLLSISGRSALVYYWAEALAGDEGPITFQGRCANAQIDRSGSLAHEGAHRCTAVDCDQFQFFREGCWLPNASRFCLGDESVSYRGDKMKRPPSDFRKGEYLTRLWHGRSWLLEQGLPGVSSHLNFALSRPGGACGSIGQLLGGFADSVPTGVFPLKRPLVGPTLGVRTVVSDGEGGETQELVTGAFVASKEWDASGGPPEGSLPQVVSGWESGRVDARGQTEKAHRLKQPASPAGGVGLYDWAASGGAWGFDGALVDGVESFGIGAASGAPNEALAAVGRARMGVM